MNIIRRLANRLSFFAVATIAATTPCSAESITLPFDSAQQPSHQNQYATTIRGGYNTDNSGTWAIANGLAVWTLYIKAPGATNLSLFFDDIALPSNSVLVVGTGTKISGSVLRQAFRTWPESGDSLLLHLTLPAEVKSSARVRVDAIFAGMPTTDLGSEPYIVSKNGSSPKQLSAINYSCIAPSDDPGSRMSRATAQVLLGGNLCTGTLINHDNADTDAWLMTASHCADNPANGVTPQEAANRVAALFGFIAPCDQSLDGFVRTDEDTYLVQGSSTIHEDIGSTGDRSDAHDIWIVELEEYPRIQPAAFLAGYDGAAVKGEGDTFKYVAHGSGRPQQFTTAAWRFNGTGSLRLEGTPFARSSARVATDITTGSNEQGASGASVYSDEGSSLGVITQGSTNTMSYSPVWQAVDLMLQQGLVSSSTMQGREAPAPAPTATPTPTPITTPAPPTPSPIPSPTQLPSDSSSGGGGGGAPLISLILLGAAAIARRQIAMR